MTFRTAAFEAYIQPARTKPQLWRLIVGIILVVAIFLGVTIGLFSLSALLGWIGMTEADGNLNTHASMAVGLLTFAGGILGVWAVVKLLHGRSFHTLLGPRATITGQRSGIRRNFIITASVVFIFQAILMTASSLYFGTAPNQPLSMVLLFLPIGTILLLIQTGAEELLFRGYLMQQLGARFKSPIIWFVLPSVTFGLIHYSPETMEHMVWWIIAAITITGLIWADLTRITGNIGAAWGWHFMNNFLLLNFVTLPESMTGFTWRLTAYGVDDMPPLLLIFEIGFLIVIWLVLRQILRPAA